MHKVNQPRSARWPLSGAAAFIFSFTLVAPALAQEAPASIRLLPEDAERGRGGPQHNFDFLPPRITGDNYQTAGFFGQKLRPYLAGNAEALAHLNLYRRQKTFFLIDRVVAVGSFGLYGQQILANGERQYFNSTQQVALGIFATSVLATIFINRNTNSHLKNAVESFNSVAHSSYWQRLQPAAVGLAAAPTGQPLLSLRWALR